MYSKPHPDDYHVIQTLAFIEAVNDFQFCVSTEVVLARYHARLAVAGA
jgi:hypothetical protein